MAEEVRTLDDSSDWTNRKWEEACSCLVVVGHRQGSLVEVGHSSHPVVVVLGSRLRVDRVGRCETFVASMVQSWGRLAFGLSCQVPVYVGSACMGKH